MVTPDAPNHPNVELSGQFDRPFHGLTANDKTMPVVSIDDF
jgi:hypothetical protein